MTQRFRLLLFALAAVAALAAGGCADKSKPHLLAETEGIYLDLDDLVYQVQMSRILNPASPEDAQYLKGLPAGEATGPDAVWFAIFMRVQNLTDETLPPADEFKITDTLENEFTPIDLDENANAFVYEPTPIEPGELIPAVDSPSSDGPIQGSLILFKVTRSSLFNRPLELHISRSAGGAEGIVDLDV